MSQTPTSPADRPTASLARRVRKWALIALGGLVLLTGGVLLGLNTAPGKRFIANQIEALSFENGMSIGIGAIEGSIYGALSIEELTLSDPQGVFLHTPQAKLDWHPFAFLVRRLEISSLTSEEVVLERLPEFTETPPSDEPLLPDFDVELVKFQIDRLVTQAPISGEPRSAGISGKAHIASGRAQLTLNLDSLDAAEPDQADHLALLIDIAPAMRRFMIELDLSAPQKGMITGLLGLSDPLRADLSGRGDWERWNGQFSADLAGEALARIDISARDGAFKVRGPLRPARLLDGQLAALSSPEVVLDLAAQVDGSFADLSGSLVSEAMRVNYAGGADIGQSMFEAMELDILLSRPDLLVENLRGRGLRAQLTLDGPFARPAMAYAVSAERLEFDDLGFVGLVANGKVVLRDDAMLVPVSARLERITGLDRVAGGRLQKVTLEGEFGYGDSRILADDLRLKSDRMDAGIVLLADLASGRYTAAIDGMIDDYRVESLGMFNIDSDVDLEIENGGGFALKGRVLTRSSRLDSDGLRDFLGGNVLAGADVIYGTDGIARLTNLSLRAPALEVEGASASYYPGGRITLAANGISQAYGPFGIEMDGTLADPNAVLTAERPGFGIGLANLRAAIAGDPAGYRLNGTADTDYGPLRADLLLGMEGPLTLDIAQADWAGIGFSGKLVQSEEGPFSGRLNASGRGLDGVVRLAPRGEVQEALLNLRARNFALDGDLPIRVGAGKLDARIILYDSPHIVAEADLTGGYLGALFLNVAKLKLDYREGAGSGQIMAEGESGAPFRIAANAQLAPNLWRAAISGRMRGIAIATSEPARIRVGQGGYDLLPAHLSVGSGSITLAGHYGDGMSLTGRLADLDIALADAFLPGLGLNGLASGNIALGRASSGAFPTGELQLSIANFSRTTADASSQRVNVNLTANLAQTKSELRAILRREGDVVGRVVANLGPVAGGEAGGGSGLTDRIMRARLGGGFRYNGAASTLFSFAGVADQTLTGAIGVAADFSGRLASPQLTGIVRGNGLTYENLTYGTRLSDLTLAGAFRNDRLEIESLTAKAGDGSVSGSGFVSLSAENGYPMDLRASLANARLARGASLSSRADGELRLTKRKGEAALLAGTITLPETRYTMAAVSAAEVPHLSGVRFRPSVGARRITGNEIPDSGPSIFDTLRYDIALKTTERLYISGMGLESEWSADLALRGTRAAPRLQGSVELIRGTLDFAGRAFALTEGQVEFRNGDLTNPTIRIAANETVDNVAVQVNVSGRAQSPQISFSSSPALPQDEILARILFGSSIEKLSPVQAVQLATSLNSLRSPGGNGLNPLGSLRSATGIDRLRVLGADEQNGRGTAIAAGQYLTDDIYVEFITDARGFTATQLEVSLTPAFSILSQAGGSGSADVRLRYSRDY